MKYNELFTQGNGIFEEVFAPEYPTEFADIFGDTDPKKLDVYALLNFGGRTIVSSINPDNVKDVVSAVIAVNVQGWEREAAAMLADYDVLNPTTEERTVTETETTNESTDGTETGSNVPFNDTEFSDTDKTSITDNKARTSERKTTETSKGTGAGKSISQEIAKELQLRRDNWRKNIIFALVNEITTKIYE